MKLIHPQEFDRCVAKYNGNFRVSQLSCWHHFLSLSFGQRTQRTHRESLRDLVNCLQAHQSKLYHLGLTEGISPGTLAQVFSGAETCAFIQKPVFRLANRLRAG